MSDTEFEAVTMASRQGGRYGMDLKQKYNPGISSTLCCHCFVCFGGHKVSLAKMLAGASAKLTAQSSSLLGGDGGGQRLYGSSPLYNDVIVSLSHPSLMVSDEMSL